MAGLSIIYLVLGVLGVILNTAATALRLLRPRPSLVAGISQSHRVSLISHDISLTLTSLVMIVGASGSEQQTSGAVCGAAAACGLYSFVLMSWLPLTTSIVLSERERHKPGSGQTTTLTCAMLTVIQISIALVSAALVAIGYIPILRTETKRFVLNDRYPLYISPDMYDPNFIQAASMCARSVHWRDEARI